MKTEAKATLFSTIREGLLSFLIVLLLAFLNLTWAGLSLLVLLQEGGIGGILVSMFGVLAVASTIMLILDIWALLTLCLAADDEGVCWRAAFRRGQMDWTNIKAVRYVDNLKQIHLIPSTGSIQRISTISLPTEALARVRGVVAERVPVENVTTAQAKLTVWANLALLYVPASHLAAYGIVRLGAANRDFSGSVASLWLGMGVFFIFIPLIPALLAAGIYWLFRRRYLPATLWIAWIVWFLLGGVILLGTLLPRL